MQVWSNIWKGPYTSVKKFTLNIQLKSNSKGNLVSDLTFGLTWLEEQLTIS